MNYISTLHSDFESNSNYLKGDDRRRWEYEFGIVHYAGPVVYNVLGFVEKNRDVVQDLFFHKLCESKNHFIQTISNYESGSNSNATLSRNCNTKGGKITLGDAFRIQLSTLVDVLQSTTPWYNI